MAKKVSTIPSYQFEDTTNPNIKRFVDRNGDWTYYYLVKEQRFVKAVNHVLSIGYNKGPRFRMYLETHTKEEIAKTLTERGDEGSRTHSAIRDLIKGLRVTMSTKYPSELSHGRQDPLNDNEWENIEAWVKWAEDYNFRIISHEETVTDGKVAGTLDALGVITVRSGDKNFEKRWWGQDVLLLPDWKSSSSIWSEYEAQTAAYLWMLVQSRSYTKFFQAFKGRIFTGVVRLGTAHSTGYQFEAWGEDVSLGEHYERFLAAKKIADRHEPEFKPTIEDIPTQFFIKIPKAKVPVAPKAKRSKKNATKQMDL